MWSGDFFKLVDRVCEALQDADPDTTYVYTDMFAVNQHPLTEGGIDGQMGADLNLLPAVINITKQGTHLVMDHEKGFPERTPLGRAWYAF